MIEMDALYEIFCRTYKERISREDFRRFIYWHARFNNKIQTMYTEEHVSYAALVPIEVSRVFNDQVKYADGLDYRIWTRSELKRKAEDVLEGHPALGYLYEGLIYGLRLRESEGHSGGKYAGYGNSHAERKKQERVCRSQKGFPVVNSDDIALGRGKEYKRQTYLGISGGDTGETL